MKKIIRNIIPILIFIILFGKSNDQIVQAQTSDPGISGSLDISQQEYDYGDEYFEPANLSGRLVELKASVHYPTNMSGGSFPLIKRLNHCLWQWNKYWFYQCIEYEVPPHLIVIGAKCQLIVNIIVRISQL